MDSLQYAVCPADTELARIYRHALSLLAEALPRAEARVADAAAYITPESAVAYAAMHDDLQRMREELMRIASELEALHVPPTG